MSEPLPDPTTPVPLSLTVEGMRRLARSLVGDAHADDVAQEAVLVALRDDGRRLGWRGWLRGVVRNKAREARRTEGRRRRHERAAVRERSAPSAAEMAAQAELHRRLLDAVLALPGEQREAVWMRFFLALPPREIALRLDVPVQTVKSRIQRALRTLREALDRRHGGARAVWLPVASRLADERTPEPRSRLGTRGEVMAWTTRLAVCGAVATAFLGGVAVRATWPSGRANPVEVAVPKQGPSEAPLGLAGRAATSSGDVAGEVALLAVEPPAAPPPPVPTNPLAAPPPVRALEPKEVLVRARFFTVDEGAFEHAHGRLALPSMGRPRLLDARAAAEFQERIAAVPGCATAGEAILLVLEGEEATYTQAGMELPDPDAARAGEPARRWALRFDCRPRSGEAGSTRVDVGIGVSVEDEVAGLPTAEDVLVQGLRVRFTARKGTSALVHAGFPDPARTGLAVWTVLELMDVGTSDLLREIPSVRPSSAPSVVPVPTRPPAPPPSAPLDHEHPGSAGACG